MAADGAGLEVEGAVRAQAFAALDRRLDRSARAPLALGLSGGGDSLALLVLALDWARWAGRPVLALTVDHGLNPDSARWTADAGATARALGADWRALSWGGAKPSTGLPAAARRARHALLADAARAAGARVLLLGHTADDVAESGLIRRETPNHGALREWTPSPAWPEGRGVFLLRPLLEMRRRALRELLAARGLGWLEDPANADLRFARARARRALNRDGPLSLSFGGKVGVGGGGAAASHFARSDAASRDLSATAGRARRPDPHPEGVGEQIGLAGVVTLDAGSLASNPRRLAQAIVCAAGGEASPSGSRLASLAARLAAGKAGTATLGGARIAFDGGMVRLCRELGRRPSPPLALAPGEPRVFDGRFEVRADAPGWRVAPLAGHAAGLPREDRRGLSGIPAAARPAIPVLLDGGGLARLPRPFGGGPGEACELVSTRLAAALGRMDRERDLTPGPPAGAVHGV